VERKNILWGLLLVNLLAAGAGLGYATLRMDHIKGTMKGWKEGITDFTSQSASAAEPAVDPVDRALSRSSGPKPRASSDAAPRPANAPPPRRQAEEAPERGSKAAPIEAAYVAPSSLTDFSNAPAPELYPFGVEKRTRPTAGEIEVELLVQNASGYFWQTAYVVVRAPDYAEAPTFEIKDWPIDGLAVLRYRFPADQLNQRMRNLRIVAVTGNRLDSPLAANVSRQREALVREFGTQDSALDEIRQSVESDTAEKARASAEAERLRKAGMIKIALPTGPGISEAFTSPIPNTQKGTPQDDAVALLREAHQAALTAQQEIHRAVELVNAEGLDVALAPGAAASASVENARAAIAQFEDAGGRLNRLLATARAEGLPLTRTRLNEYADVLITLIDTVERQVTPYRADFTLQVK
jgi:hypothetical protein